MPNSVVLPITEVSQAGEARRLASTMAASVGFGDTERGKVAIIATELANNLAQHASQGELLLRRLQWRDITGIELMSLDRGPGMADVTRCLQDGYSTAGTPGTGLGAVMRMSSEFDIYSQPGTGTAIVSRFWLKPRQLEPASPLEHGVVNVPKAGEDVCGDGWAVAPLEDRMLFLVVDGLGHGPLAAEASRQAIRTFDEYIDTDPVRILEAAHQALRSTRGAAMAVTEVDLARQRVRFAGVGNISATLVSPEGSRSMASHNGTIGHEVRRVQEFTYPWPRNGRLIMSSDGLTTQWRIDRYPGLVHRHPSLIAGVLFRDFNRGRDDITVLVASEP